MKDLINFILCFLLLAAIPLHSCDSSKTAQMESTDAANYSPAISALDIEPVNREQYNAIIENPFIRTEEQAVSTFSVDADGGSYTNVRRFLSEGSLPPADAVRTEEFLNFFAFDYTEPKDNVPIGLNGEVSSCPWNKDHKLVRIGLKGKSYSHEQLPPANLVLLVDVSGSMSDRNKLPLLRSSFNILADMLRPQDKLSIVTYAGSAGILLESTAGNEKKKIKQAIEGLESGGSTNGAEGIVTAYELAQKNFVPDGNNRVILATDGDFNVGISSQEELIKLIEDKRDMGIFLTTIGVGAGNLQEGQMEQIADHGNGNYEYIDNFEQARKLFREEFSKMYTVAQDVKVQVRFNPEVVSRYRLIGYENRVLNEEDFETDSTDAGEIGSGQTITALYEIEPVKANENKNAYTFKIDFRYKMPVDTLSRALELVFTDTGTPFEQASENMHFAASVASFALILRNSEYKGSATYEDVIAWAGKATAYDPEGHRKEFIRTVETASRIKLVSLGNEGERE